MKKDLLKSGAFKILSNKFVIASVVFAAWILFFDENSISRHLRAMSCTNRPRTARTCSGLR